MNKEIIIRKLTSRKFWAAVAEFVTMLIVAFGAEQETAVQVSALIMAGAAVVAYIVGEGLVDAKKETGDGSLSPGESKETGDGSLSPGESINLP